MPYVYFAQEPYDKAIKIGISHNVRKRIAQLENSMPHNLQIIGMMSGDFAKEQELHMMFEPYRIKGEWFKPDKAILDYIENNARITEVPMDLKEEVKEIAKKSRKQTPAVKECRKLLELANYRAEEAQAERVMTIDQVAQLLGVTTATLRNWDKNGKLKALRTEGKHRRYKESDVTAIRKQMMTGAEFMIQGTTPRTLKEELEKMLAQFQPEDSITLSIRHDALMDKVRITIDSADRLSSTTRSFGIR
jgi:excisionase family DNA binding protein